MWNNNDGRDIYLQFFFEGQMVSLFESFYVHEPSMFSIESIENSTVLVLQKKYLHEIIKKYPEIEHKITQMISFRFIDYMHYFLSRIKEKPEDRYKEILEKQPQIIKQIPDYLVASYLELYPCHFQE